MWTQTTLGELCKMYQPKTISAKEMVADGDYVVFGANGIIGRYDKYNHEEPQLLVTCRGATCGAVNVSEPFSWINGNAMVIKPDLEKVSLKYMEYLFRGGINLSTAITGAAQPQITRKSLEPIQFSYPPLAEQQRIVAKLDAAFAEIDRAVDSTKSKINEGSAIYKSMARKVFFENPNKVPISAVAEIIMGQSPKGDTYNSEGKGVPLINGPVEFERDDFGKSKSIKFTTAPTKFCEAGDTLLCVRGSTTGRMNIAREADLLPIG